MRDSPEARRSKSPHKQQWSIPQAEEGWLRLEAGCIGCSADRIGAQFGLWDRQIGPVVHWAGAIEELVSGAGASCVHHIVAHSVGRVGHSVHGHLSESRSLPFTTALARPPARLARALYRGHSRWPPSSGICIETVGCMGRALRCVSIMKAKGLAAAGSSATSSRAQRGAVISRGTVLMLEWLWAIHKFHDL